MKVLFTTPVPERRSTSISGAYFGSFSPVAILGENVISVFVNFELGIGMLPALWEDDVLEEL